MTGPPRSCRGPDQPRAYELRLAGHLDDRWAEWLEARDIVRDDDACTTVTVVVADQAQLHGLLSPVRDMGVTLLSLTRSDA